MVDKYNPYESSAINSVREQQLNSIVDGKFFDDKKEPVYNPRLVLLNEKPIAAESLQARVTLDTYRYCKCLSATGGSNLSIPYNNSSDSYLVRSKLPPEG